MTQKKIIIADDNKEAISFLAETIKKFDEKIQVENVENGENLIAKVGNNNYDLIFTDNDMGEGIYGIEAIKRIRGFNRTVPIYMISADSWAKEIALSNGANGFILKNPIREQILEILVEQFGN